MRGFQAGYAVYFIIPCLCTLVPVQLASSRLCYTCYDFGFAVEPAWTTEANRVGFVEGAFRAAVAADWIAAISEASRRQFIDAFPDFPVERVRMIHPAFKRLAA